MPHLLAAYTGVDFIGSSPAIDPMLMINPSFNNKHLLCQQMIQATSHVRLVHGPDHLVTWDIRYLMQHVGFAVILYITTHS